MRIHVRSFQLSGLFLALLLLTGLVNITLAQGGNRLISRDWLSFTLDARSDLDLVATVTMGDDRPPGWSGSFDLGDPQFPLLVRLDLELLAGELLGTSMRPEGWFGAIPSTTDAWARDVRHDLELLADVALDPGRPESWVGGPPLMRCDRITQAAYYLLEPRGFSLQADRTAPNFCELASQEVSVFAETRLLIETITPSTSSVPESPSWPVVGSGASVGAGNVINRYFSVSFHNRSATHKAGIVPFGTEFTPVSRSATQFSNMMLISGQGFTVYVDYMYTGVDADSFRSLPAIDGESQTSCSADWCYPYP